MKKIIPFMLAALAVLSIAVTSVLWIQGGFHQGWSQTKVPVEHVDPITGIEYVEYEDRFIAGLEVISGGVGGFLAIGVPAGYLFVRGRRNETHPDA